MKYNVFTDQFGRLYLGEGPAHGWHRMNEDRRCLEQINEDKTLSFSHEGEIELS